MMEKKEEILPGIRMVGLTLYVEEDDALIFSDLHLGFEEELRSLGMLVPRFQYKEIVRHLDEVFARIAPRRKIRKAVIAGDLKHEFGRISAQEWDEVLSFLDYLKVRCEETVLVKGNHDTILGPIARRGDVKILDHCVLDKSKIYVAHGHSLARDEDMKKAKTIIIGHGHPALALSDGVRTERTKCFLKGKWRKKTLIQLPSMTFSAEGSDILREETLSPYTKDNRGSFEAYCVEGFEVYFFGNLKDMQVTSSCR